MMRQELQGCMKSAMRNGAPKGRIGVLLVS